MLVLVAALLIGLKVVNASDLKLLGVGSALILFSLLALAVSQQLSYAIRSRDRFLTGAIWIVTVVLAVKTACLLLIRGFDFDVFHFLSWAIRIADVGPGHYYQPGHLLAYTPGYLYVLWIPGALSRALGEGGRILIRMPPVFADAVLALVVLTFVQRSRQRASALAAMLMVALNPALVFDTVVWGQNDSVFALAAWLSAVTILARKNELAWALAAISILIDPLGLILLPVLALWMLAVGDGALLWRSLGVALAVFLIGLVPFQFGHQWNGILDSSLSSMAAYRRETVVYAFNFATLFGGLKPTGAGILAGVSYFSVEVISLTSTFGFAGFYVYHLRSASAFFYSVFLMTFGYFLFAQWMYPHCLFVSIVAAVPLALESAEMMLVFSIVTLTCLFNLAYVFHTLAGGQQLGVRDELSMICAMLNVLAFIAAVHFGVKSARIGSVRRDRVITNGLMGLKLPRSSL
ncbi:MAG: hypothetical protein WCA22_07315 [Candidatus Binatus sp.]